MATIAGNIKDIRSVKTEPTGGTRRESWRLSLEFGVYSSGADTATLLAVGAAISDGARDGKVRTIKGAICEYPGRDTADVDVYFTVASVDALTVSSDDLTGEISDVAGTELSAAASKGMSILVICDVA